MKIVADWELHNMKLKYKNINIIDYNNYLITQGLDVLIGKELRLSMQQHDLEDYIKLYIYIIDYIIESDKLIISPDQTIVYHSWVLKFIGNNFLYYDIWEVSKQGETYINGADCAIEIIKQQQGICHSNNTKAIFPLFNQLVVISECIFKNLNDFEAVRYPSPDHMTGWWITTSLFNGDVKSLLTVHYYHVAFKRHDILQYLALPYGYRVNAIEKIVNILFDDNVFNE